MVRKHRDKALMAGIVCRHASHKLLELKPLINGLQHQVYSMCTKAEMQLWDWGYASLLMVSYIPGGVYE